MAIRSAVTYGLRLIVVTGLVVGAAVAVQSSASAEGSTSLFALELNGTGKAGAAVSLSLVDNNGGAVGLRQRARLIQSKKTDASGRASFAVEPADALPFTDASGYANFESMTMVDGLPTFFSFSRRWTGSSWVDQTGARGGEPVEVALEDRREALSAGARAVAASPSLAVASSEVPCTWYVESNGNATTKVGEYHAGADTKGKFVYGTGADSDISVGYNYGSGFSLSGTGHVGNSRSAASTWNRGPNFHKQLTSVFSYVKWHLTLGPSCTSSSASFGKRWYKVTPGSWMGGATEGPSISGPFCTGTNRVAFGKATEFDRGTGRSYSYGGAASAFGASLTATSGYSSRVDMHWEFGTATSTHYLCGTPSVTTSKIVYSR